MNLKELVLERLESLRGESISGETLASEFQVSRSAIWKSIKALREEGHEIDAVKNRGYMLRKDSDMLTVSGIEKWLKPELKGLVQVKKEVDSTNERVKALSLANAQEGTVMLADTQTNGKGRMGRKFESPKGLGIYMSILLKPHMDMQNGVFITAAAAVAVSLGIEKITGIKTGIKWVNDIYLNGKKIAGILTEGISDIETGMIKNVVIGIGINFKDAPNAYSEDLRDKIGCIYDGEPVVTRNILAAEIINQIWEICKNLENREFIKEYRERSILIGKNITYIKNGNEYPARVIDIDESGGLVVLSCGKQEILHSGEISVKF